MEKEEFLKAFGATAEPAAEEPDKSEPDEENPSPEGEADNTDEPDDTDNPEGSDEHDEPDEADEPQQKPDKQAHAFAEMRIQNKRQRELLENIGEVLGLDKGTPPDQLFEKLQDKVLKSQAEKQNVPEELYKRLHNLEKDNQTFVQEQMKRTALLGFQKVKDTFDLKNNEVQAFAEGLQKDGVDPFTSPIDLVREYKVRNFEKLVALAEERGAQAEAQRVAKAQQTSSSTGKKEGKKRQGGEKIDTLRELSNFLSTT